MTKDLKVTTTDPVKKADLKEKFKSRSIPLQQDFYDLIEMADAGRLAAGLSPEQDGTKDSARTGLILDANKRLAVRPKTNGGLDVAQDGVSVKKGNGIDASADAVTIKAVANGGLVVEPGGVSVKTGGGIETGADGVTVKAKPNGGLVVSPEGVALQGGNGIDLVSGALAVKVDGTRGLAVNADGIGITDAYGVRALARLFDNATLYGWSKEAEVFVNIYEGAHVSVKVILSAGHSTGPSMIGRASISGHKGYEAFEYSDPINSLGATRFIASTVTPVPGDVVTIPVVEGTAWNGGVERDVSIVLTAVADL